MRALMVSLLVFVCSLGGVAAWLYHQGVFAVKTADTVAKAEDHAAVADLNTQGVKLSVGRVKAAVAVQQSAAALARQYRAEAQAAGDANAPLDPDRAQRLRDADDRLCRMDPSLDGCAANRDAGGSPAFVLAPAGS